MSLFYRLSDSFEVNWPEVYELHRQMEMDMTRTLAARDYHRTQAFLVWTKHLKPPRHATQQAAGRTLTKKVPLGRPWTWENALAEAREAFPSVLLEKTAVKSHFFPSCTTFLQESPANGHQNPPPPGEMSPKGDKS